MNTLFTEGSPLFCNLPPTEKEERLKFVQKEIFSKFESYEEVDNGYVFSYVNTEQMAHILLDFIVKEQTCCSFIDFDLAFRPSQKIIKNQVTTSTNNVEAFKVALRKMFSI